MSIREPVVVGVADDHDTALRYAAAEAVRDDRPLRIVHVVPPAHGLAATEGLLISFEGAELVAEDLVRRQAERAEELTRGLVDVTAVVRHGGVISELAAVATDSDHLVLQRRREGRLDRLLRGSTVAGLAACAPVPVVSVPEEWPGPGRVPHVTVALGEPRGTEPGEALIARGFVEAERRGAALTVVHAWYLPSDYGQSPVARPALDDWLRIAGRHVEERLAPHRDEHPTVDVRVDVVHERPADALVRAARHTDVLLVGRRRSTGLVHLGSVVRTVVREATCPVIVVTPSTPTHPRHRSAIEAGVHDH